MNTGGGISKSISNYIENNKYCNMMAPNIDFMPPPIGAGGILFSGYPSFRPTVRPSEARNTLFPPVHWSVGPSGKPLPSCGLCVNPSIRRGFRAFPGESMGEWPKILHADVTWPPSELAGLCSRSVDFPPLGQIWGIWAFPADRREDLT